LLGKGFHCLLSKSFRMVGHRWPNSGDLEIKPLQNSLYGRLSRRRYSCTGRGVTTCRVPPASALARSTSSLDANERRSAEANASPRS